MKILAIETSCDETACSVVENGRNVLSNVIASQIDLHAKTGGVVPEVAAREHVLKIIPVIDRALDDAGLSLDDIDALACTKGPGLISSLIIGTETASVISYARKIPLIPVNHIAGHLYSSWLESEDEPQFPILVLTVSGGHNDLVLMKGHGDFEVLGETLDDAAGEAFDKIARLLELGYPGGPAISKLAENGDPGKYALPRAWMGKDNMNFSFSGLKTAVLDLTRKNKEVSKPDVAASFQEAVVDALVGKLMIALKKNPSVKEVHVVGGVSANKRLREMTIEKITSHKIRFPKKLAYCTDNAAMIGAAAFYMGEDLKVSNLVPKSGFEI